ncbi:hypothetical protein EG68_06127 [Paragonimus skrjabini miyazakii]|uniref:Uncharacterized protein n=1 Tax=Paragonimus skrjabini miyazakii TaxID=59628 RepID=A0A8S9YTP9_9TREM|nr:hypothetical protein EG68_06127 [Paragonimus skrjabini miyazakii]
MSEAPNLLSLISLILNIIGFIGNLIEVFLLVRTRRSRTAYLHLDIMQIVVDLTNNLLNISTRFFRTPIPYMTTWNKVQQFEDN